MNAKSLFSIDHERCTPQNWTISDLIMLQFFMRTGDMKCAGRLKDMGIELLDTDHHVAKNESLAALRAAYEMRQAQKAYFANRTQENLIRSKSLEAAFDALVDPIFGAQRALKL